MPPLHKLWLALERLPGVWAAGAEWKLCLGNDFELLKQFLQPTDHLASTLPDASDPHACYRVVRHAADDIVGVHDGDGTVIRLSKLDALIYRADVASVANNAVTALGWEPIKVGNNRTSPLRVGTARPFDIPVFLAIPHDPGDLRHAAEALAAKHESSFVLLAPTARFMRPPCEEVLKGRRAYFLPLMESIEIQDGSRWVASQFAEQRLALLRESHAQQAQRRPIPATPANGKSGKDRAKPALKSWTQPDLDAAIREYKARRASNYGDLLEGVRAGRTGAKKAAQEMFGRNAIARELGVKAPAMVTKSPEWQSLADELGLSRGKDRNTVQRRKVGLEIALESSASNSQPALEHAVRQETIQLIKKSMSKTEAAAVIEKLELGETTDDQARALIEVVKDQKREGRTRRVRSNL